MTLSTILFPIGFFLFWCNVMVMIIEYTDARANNEKPPLDTNNPKEFIKELFFGLTVGTLVLLMHFTILNADFVYKDNIRKVKSWFIKGGQAIKKHWKSWSKWLIVPILILADGYYGYVLAVLLLFGIWKSRGYAKDMYHFVKAYLKLTTANKNKQRVVEAIVLEPQVEPKYERVWEVDELFNGVNNTDVTMPFRALFAEV